jgi:hypothetical protein
MKTFFHNFPRIDLKINTTQSINYTDLFRFVDVRDVFLPNYNNYAWYEIKDGERPDNVSQTLYSSPEYYWTFFIVNDRLKNGMSEWPLSTNALDTYVKEKYGEYGIVVIEPTTDVKSGLAEHFTAVLDETLGVPILHGLDISFPYLRVKRLVSNDADSMAEIHMFDSKRQQLWIKNSKDRFFFDDVSGEGANQIQFVLVNPYDQYEDAELYGVAEASIASWLESTRDGWYNDFFGEMIAEDVKAEIESKMVFAVRQFYDQAFLAPDHFEDHNGNRIDDLTHTLITAGGFPVPYFEIERAKNDAKRFIQVIKPNLIYRFTDEYELALKSTNRIA